MKNKNSSSSLLLIATSLFVNLAEPLKTFAQIQPPLERISWINYFSAQGKPTQWSNTVRTRFVKGLQKTLAGNDVIYGVSSDPDLTELGPDYQWEPRSNKKGEVSQNKINLMNSIEQDNAENFKARIQLKVKTYSALEPAVGKSHRIWWQFGNEINALESLYGLREWERCKTAPGTSTYDCSKTIKNPDFKASCLGTLIDRNNPCVIPYYVEYYLAPAVEAVRAQEKLCGCKYPIVLGSIGTGPNPSSRAWLNQLLSYKVQSSKFAPSLTGKYVYQLINVISTHYLATNERFYQVGFDRIYQPEGWKKAMDEIYDTWMGKGTIKSIWSTEEIGKRGAVRKEGSRLAVQITARLLHYWTIRNMTPKQGRVSLFQWEAPGTQAAPGITSANESLSTLYGFLGNTPLRQLNNPIVGTVPDYLEAYAFQSVRNFKKRVFMVYDANSDDPKSRDPYEIYLTNFAIQDYGWSSAKVNVHLFSPSGRKTLTFTLPSSDGKFNIQVPRTYSTDTPALLITLEKLS
ncbi:MAG TPA: hypothetical protein V6D19_20600 [Stenomitos sp.]